MYPFLIHSKVQTYFEHSYFHFNLYNASQSRGVADLKEFFLLEASVNYGMMTNIITKAIYYYATNCYYGIYCDCQIKHFINNPINIIDFTNSRAPYSYLVNNLPLMTIITNS